MLTMASVRGEIGFNSVPYIKYSFGRMAGEH